MPFAASLIYTFTCYNYTKGNPYEGSPKFPSKIPIKENPQLKMKAASLYSNRVDNFMNEFMAIGLANS